MTSWKPGVAERSAKFATFSWTPAHEKSRQGGVVRDAAVLSAFGVGLDGRRRILGVSVALSEAEVPITAFWGGLSWKTWSDAACAACGSSPPTITPA